MVRKHLVGVVLAAAALAACGSDQPAAAPATTTVPSNPYGVLDIDAPAANEPILSVTTSAGTATFTVAQFRSLGATKVTLDEPFVKKQQTFVGVPFAAIVAKTGMNSNAQVLTVALNDYRWTGSVADMIASQALVAYEVDGRSIGYDEGGPIRLVYPNGTALATNLDAWNWSLSELSEQS